MSVIHMIHGFVGAGKTAFSKKLEKEIKAVRFSPDEWIRDLYGNPHGNPMLPEYQKNVDKLIWKIAEGILSANVDVILDFGFWSYDEREKARNRARALGVETRLYNIQCPEDVMRDRVLNRSAHMPDDALFIDENAFNEFKKYFEPIDPQLEESILIKTHV